MTDGRTITIRPYRDGDFPEMCALHDAARRDELRLAGLGDAFVPLETAAEREGLFSYNLLVAELDGVLAGFCAFFDDELAWLYVDPAHARKGVGRALSESALAELGRPVYLEVLCGNEPALSLYRSLGFREERVAEGRMPGNEGFAVRAHCMVLD